MEEQKLPYKDGDIVKERHVYKGPKGEGYIDYEYRMNAGELEYKGTHVGPEARVVPKDWTQLPDRVETQSQVTGQEDKVVDEVLTIIDPDDPGEAPLYNYKKIVERKTVQVPVYSDVEVTIKHPIKEDFDTIKTASTIAVEV